MPPPGATSDALPGATDVIRPGPTFFILILTGVDRASTPVSHPTIWRSTPKCNKPAPQKMPDRKSHTP